MPTLKFLAKMSSDDLFRPVIILSIITFGLYALHRKLTAKRAIPESIPWVGLRDEWFPRYRANLRDMKAGRQNMIEGYIKVIWLETRSSNIQRR